MSGEVRATQQSNIDYTTGTTSASTANTGLFKNQPDGNSYATQSAHGSGNSKIDPNVKNSRLAKIKQNIIDNYKISLEQFNNLLKAALNLSEEDIFTCEDEKFQSIMQSFKTALDKQKNSLKTQEDFEAATAELKKVYENSNSQEEAKAFEAATEGKELLQLINEKTGKKYKSIKEIPDKELEDIIRHLIKKYMSNTEGSKTGAEKSAFMKQLLASLKKVGHDDYKRLYNAFLKVAPEADKNFAVLLNIIDNLKQHKGEFEKFLKEDLAAICQANNLNYEKIKGALLKIAEAIKSGNLDDIETLKALLDSFDPENIYQSYKARQAKGEQLSEDEQKFVNDWERVKDIKKRQAEGGEISPEDIQFLQEFEQKMKGKAKDIKQAIIAAFGVLDPSKVEQFMSELSPEELENVFEKIYDLYKMNPGYKLDAAALDEITGGKFSSYEPTASDGSTAGYSSSDSGTVGYGLGYEIAPEKTKITALQNLVEKRSELVNTEAPIQYSLDKSDNGKKSLASKMVETSEGFATYAKIFGWKKAAVEAGKHFQNVTQDVKSALDKYVADMFKNDKALLGFASDCHNNSALVKDVIASRLDDENSIKNLNVVHDIKQDALAKYKDRHPEEEKKEQA